jgi:hypothetical protein
MAIAKQNKEDQGAAIAFSAFCRHEEIKYHGRIVWRRREFPWNFSGRLLPLACVKSGSGLEHPSFHLHNLDHRLRLHATLLTSCSASARL